MQPAYLAREACVAWPKPLGRFVRLTRLGSSKRDEWKAVLPDLTEVVVADVDGLPCLQSLAKAASVVKNRSYLEERARQLLVPYTRNDGRWRLVTIAGQGHDLARWAFAWRSRAVNWLSVR